MCSVSFCFLLTCQFLVALWFAIMNYEQRETLLYKHFLPCHLLVRLRFSFLICLRSWRIFLSFRLQALTFRTRLIIVLRNIRINSIIMNLRILFLKSIDYFLLIEVFNAKCYFSYAKRKNRLHH